jgi:hypothetical protein
MLNAVPEQLTKMARSVVINHPNAWNCEAYRKKMLRTDPTTQIGGIPTLGGLSVLDSEDESAIEWEWIGNGFALQAEPYQPSLMMSSGGAINNAAIELRFLIVPESVDDFVLKKHDVIYLLLGESIKLAWEIIAIEAMVNIAPYTTRYILNKRSDLDLM